MGLLGQAAKNGNPVHAERLSRHVLAQLTCMGTHTITGLLTACGQMFKDWSADYRLYDRDRADGEGLFKAVREQLCAKNGPLVVALDDTRLHKSGKKIHGVKLMRDPLGPHFRPNFILAQRFVQLSMAWHEPDGVARMVPVDWRHAPLPIKPRKDADQTAWEEYHQLSSKMRVSQVAAESIRHLRAHLDHEGHADRVLWNVVDGGFTNQTMLRQLPERTILVGRIRADAKIYTLPQEQPCGPGRHRVYGELLPTPRQLLQDPLVQSQPVQAFWAGERRTFLVKTLTPVLWRTNGKQPMMMLAIKAMDYRLKNGKRKRGEPAFLICTDPQADPADVLQHYLRRWDIETNFRDEKTIFGVGEAQVRTPSAVQNVTACAVASYALLLTAAMLHTKPDDPILLPPPKWHARKQQRITTNALVQNLRNQLLACAVNFSGFEVKNKLLTNSPKILPNLKTACIYAVSTA